VNYFCAMQLHIIETGFFKLDGGAMYGIVPKSIWNKLNPADDNNMCTWAMRCLLVEDGDRLILIDTGIGNKQSEKFFGFYYLSDTCPLEAGLRQAGFGMEEVTDVILTHLHFDHSGGAVVWNQDRTGYVPAFPQARYWSHERHWRHALSPNPREKPSFLHENFMPLEASGQLQFLEAGDTLGDHVRIRVVDGHTVAMMCPEISYKDRTIVYCADLIPSSTHTPLNYVMGYDIEPLKTMHEKHELLQEAVEKDFLLFFEHDPRVAITGVSRNEKGNYMAGLPVQLSDI
jgi:glyoxylase-like metal-dependent hydrolase (beta-lactamase superfamily II)